MLSKELLLENEGNHGEPQICEVSLYVQQIANMVASFPALVHQNLRDKINEPIIDITFLKPCLVIWVGSLPFTRGSSVSNSMDTSARLPDLPEMPRM